MAIITKYTKQINDIKAMCISNQEKIELLKSIKVIVVGTCYNCKGKEAAVRKLVEQFVQYEIKQLE